MTKPMGPAGMIELPHWMQKAEIAGITVRCISADPDEITFERNGARQSLTYFAFRAYVRTVLAGGASA